MSLTKQASTLTINEATKQFNEKLKSIDQSEGLVISVTRSQANGYNIGFEPLVENLDDDFSSPASQQESLKFGNDQTPNATDLGVRKMGNALPSKGTSEGKDFKRPKKPTYCAGEDTFLAKVLKAQFGGHVATIKNGDCEEKSQHSDRRGSYDFENPNLFFLAVILHSLQADFLATTGPMDGDKPIIRKIEHLPTLDFPELSEEILAHRFSQLLYRCNN